jgi:hypothetical protein
VDPLEVALESQLADQDGIQAGAEPPGAGRGREEVEVTRLAPRAGQGGEQGAASEIHAGLSESGLQVVQGLGGAKAGLLDGEVSPLDSAVEEEAATPLVGVARQGQHLGLAEAVRGVGGPHGEDPRHAHV